MGIIMLTAAAAPFRTKLLGPGMARRGEAKSRRLS